MVSTALSSTSSWTCCRRTFSSFVGEDDKKTSESNETEDPVCDVVQGPNLLRTTSVARPSPSLMLLPGLRSLPFWTSSPDVNDKSKRRIAYGDPMVAHIVEHLESHVETIRQDYITNSKDLPSDYKDDNNNKSFSGDHANVLHKGQWDWYSYMNKGSVQGSFAFHFRETAKILQTLREDHLLFEGTPFGFAFFSTLHEQASIQAHTAPMNLRLRIHLPLIVPQTSTSENQKTEDGLPPCGIRVGNMVQPWIQDQALVLDDSFNHEVWNHTDEKRVILLVDIWHPDISHGEKQEIVQLFQTARQQGLWRR